LNIRSTTDELRHWGCDNGFTVVVNISQSALAYRSARFLHFSVW